MARQRISDPRWTYPRRGGRCSCPRGSGRRARDGWPRGAHGHQRATRPAFAGGFLSDSDDALAARELADAAFARCMLKPFTREDIHRVTQEILRTL
jgi:hypothetical protein